MFWYITSSAEVNVSGERHKRVHDERLIALRRMKSDPWEAFGHRSGQSAYANRFLSSVIAGTGRGSTSRIIAR